MKYSQGAGCTLSVLFKQWLSFAIFTQAGAALEGNYQEFYREVAEDFNRYGIEKRRM